MNAINAYRASGASLARSATLSTDARRIAAAWTAYATGDLSDLQEDTQSRSLVGENESEFERTLAAGATVGPLLTTAWGQGSPYNLMTPDDSCDGGHTVTGCVATAWAQLLRYWAWPIQGAGSHEYTWTRQTLDPDTLDPLTETLSANFEVNYGWDLMPDLLSQESSEAEKDAVSQLMYHMGVAAEMAYGCDGSGSNAWADDILGVYFNYKPDTLLYINRATPHFRRIRNRGVQLGRQQSAHRHRHRTGQCPTSGRSR
ncbi:C10 family peptidase [Desulfatitalea tepidiphila]|uniref:C10 family peptidase n=1 Tax=Desulfatitalea tepidiphila TaxID=1185843 RepID=UPI0006B40970|nr:C10 family peptidase [Desulfatitalea tepidiphila]